MKSAAVNAPFKEASNRRGDGLSADSNGPVEKRLSARLGLLFLSVVIRRQRYRSIAVYVVSHHNPFHGDDSSGQ